MRRASRRFDGAGSSRANRRGLPYGVSERCATSPVRETRARTRGRARRRDGMGSGDFRADNDGAMMPADIVKLLVLALACASGAASPAQAQPATDSTRLALQGYARLARGAYADAVRGAEGLRTAVQQLLERPSRETLAQARE